MGTETFLGLLAPELTVALTALVLLFIDWLGKGRLNHHSLFIGLALFGVALAFAFSFFQIGSPLTTVWGGTYRFDDFSAAFKLLMLLGACLILLMTADAKTKTGIGSHGNFYYLLLTALLGAMMVTSSADMITLLLSFELLSLSAYIMAGTRRHDTLSAKTAFKMFANGGIATALILFSMSYIYGFTGTTNLYEISLILNTENHSSLLFNHRTLLIFVFMIGFIGLLFKFLSLWTPNVYERIPTAVAAFLNVTATMAGFALLFRLFLIPFMNAPGIDASAVSGPVSIFVTVKPYIGLIAAFAMIGGHVAALRQKSMMRLFAFASVAQAGYILMPFVSLTNQTLSNTWFYLLAYLFMSLGALAVIQVVAEKTSDTRVKNFSGLYQRSPLAALALGFFYISLAGIPLTSGFVGKYNIFMEAWHAGHFWLAIIMAAAVIISCFYYFRLTIKLFLRDDESHAQKLSIPPGIGTVISVGVIGTLIFGIFPDAAFGFFNHYLPMNNFFKGNF